MGWHNGCMTSYISTSILRSRSARPVIFVFTLICASIANGCANQASGPEVAACQAFLEERYQEEITEGLTVEQIQDEPIRAASLRERYYPGELDDAERRHFAAIGSQDLALRTVEVDMRDYDGPGFFRGDRFECRFLLVDGSLYRRDRLEELAADLAFDIRLSEMAESLGPEEQDHGTPSMYRNRVLMEECCLP